MNQSRANVAKSRRSGSRLRGAASETGGVGARVEFKAREYTEEGRRAEG